MKVFTIVPKLLIILILFSSTIFSQLELSTYTDKDIYDYGETIKLYCRVTNAADTTFEFFAPTYQSCQAEFSFNDFNSWEHNACLATVELLTFLPNQSKIYSWVIEPNKFGLPNKDGTQTIIGHYYFDLKDTIHIQAPLFLGGEINVGFTEEKTDSVEWIKDSLNVNVMEHHQFEDKISENWIINGHQIDSIMNYLIYTDLFIYAENAVFIEYENIVNDNPLNYYPINIGDRKYFTVERDESFWHLSNSQKKYQLNQTVLKDTVLDNNKRYFKIEETRSDTNLVSYYYERIDSIKAKVYRYDELVKEDNEYVFLDLGLSLGEYFKTYLIFYGQAYFDSLQFIETSPQNIFEENGEEYDTRVFSLTNSSWYFSLYRLSKNIGISYHTNDVIDTHNETHYINAAVINGKIYGDTILVNVKNGGSKNISSGYSLSQNYPNPFNPSTTIKYSLPVDLRYKYQDVRLVVYDILGREAATLVNAEQKPGNYEIEFDGSNLSSGIYYYKLTAGNYSKTKKMILIK